MNNNKLNRKLEIVPGEKKEYKGNTFVGFLACTFILALIIGFIYYLQSKGLDKYTRIAKETGW